MNMSVLEAPEAPVVPHTHLDDETRRILAEAKGLIARRWAQQVEQEWTDRVGKGGGCVHTTIIEVTGTKTEAERIERAAFDMSLRQIFEWNDAPGRTHEEVVALFDKALMSS